MKQIPFAIAFILITTLSSQAQRVSIHFTPESERFEEAAREYQALWEAEGDRIIEVLESVSELKFPEREIQAIVYEGISRSGSAGFPMRMRASYTAGTKKATLIHELGHRHIAQLMRRPKELDEHRVLFLFLYDVWEHLYGKGFADEQVEVEKKRQGVYDYKTAWEWALSQSREERAKRFQEVRRENQRGG
jgi:hypothetical protein